MLRLISRLKKKKTSSMSQEPSTPGLNQPLSNSELQAASAIAPPPTPYTDDQIALFLEAYDCTKNNRNWNTVTSAISNHPEWLTRIPQGRRWTMLHQIVFCGNIPHLNQVLAYQISNEEFRLLCKALDDKTVREVAAERAHVCPQMLRCIERLVASDQLLNNARDGKWQFVKQFLRQQADIVNEKPPYRKYYLAHFLASTGQLDMFKDLSNLSEFKLDLIADNKTINQVARENNHIEFAEYIENLCPNINQIAENHNQAVASADVSNSAIQSPSFSHGFHDDPGIMIFSLNPNSFGSMFLSQTDSLSTSSHHHHHSSHDHSFATHSLIQGQHSTNSDQNNQGHNKTSKVKLPPPMTDEQQADYEKTVMENIKKFSADNLQNAITCCITKGILRDPVVAADGFTYEREAIVNWFKHSTRSPMTNQEIENQELKPNHAIKSILQSLSESNKGKKKSDDKSKTNNNVTKH